MRHSRALLAAGIFVAAFAFAAFVRFSPPKPEPAPLPPAVQPTYEAKPTRQYRDAALGFSVDYPESLQAITDKDAMAISGYIPVCDPMTAVACFLLPREAYAGKNFDGAGFAVNVLADRKTEAECYVSEGNAQPRSDELINGVIYKSFANGDAAMSHRSQGLDLRVFRQGACLDLSMRIATTVFEVYEPGLIQRFTEDDEREVMGLLEQALEGLRWE